MLAFIFCGVCKCEYVCVCVFVHSRHVSEWEQSASYIYTLLTDCQLNCNLTKEPNGENSLYLNTEKLADLWINVVWLVYVNEWFASTDEYIRLCLLFISYYIIE